MRLVDWVRRNKFATLLLLVVAFFLFKQWKNSVPTPLMYDGTVSTGSYSTGSYAELGAPMAGIAQQNKMRSLPPVADYAPAPEVSDRMVVQNSDLSLLVKNVRESIDTILQTTRQIGGYMVNSSLSSPGESPTGNLTIRVPAGQLPRMLDTLRGLAIKVVSENLTGQDVTDQYVDNEARLLTMERTKMKFEELFARAVEISDITNLQREILSVQSQIDALKGQQQYLQKNADMARITIYLSTDELALPYAPQDTWRPSVIFKLAVRSIVGHFRTVAEWFIWIGVYSIIWIPALVLLWYFKKRMKK